MDLHRDSTAAELVAAYEADGTLTIDKLAAQCGRSSKWVRTRLVHGGANMRPKGRRATHTVNAADARRAYRTHKTVAATADALGVPERVIVPVLRSDTRVELGNAGRPRQEWTDERVETELRDFLSTYDGGGLFPSQGDFRAAKRFALLKAIARTGGTARWASEVGLTVRTAGRRPAVAA